MARIHALFMLLGMSIFTGFVLASMMVDLALGEPLPADPPEEDPDAQRLQSVPVAPVMTSSVATVLVEEDDPASTGPRETPPGPEFNNP